jgi:hypothetical protein
VPISRIILSRRIREEFASEPTREGVLIDPRSIESPKLLGEGILGSWNPLVLGGERLCGLLSRK